MQRKEKTFSQTFSLYRKTCVFKASIPRAVFTSVLKRLENKKIYSKFVCYLDYTINDNNKQLTMKKNSNKFNFEFLMYFILFLSLNCT